MDVWFAGAACATLSQRLKDQFHESCWLEMELRASRCWAKAALAVTSHYHHLVAPAMVASADCEERSGDRARAFAMYSAVVLDFNWLLDEEESEPEGADDEPPARGNESKDADNRSEEFDYERYLTLRALRTALVELSAGECTQVKEIELAPLLARTETILERLGPMRDL